MPFQSAEIKLRKLAALNSTLQADLGTNPFRWYNRQLLQNVVADVTPGACVRLMRVSTQRGANMGGIMNLTAIRFQIDVLDLDSEAARRVANNIVDWIGTVNLCSSTPNAISSNPNFLMNQRAGMIPIPQQPNGPVYVETLDFKVFNREDLQIV